jgi:hypothetical protein
VIQLEPVLVAHGEASEAEQPADRPLDDPAPPVAPQLASVLKAILPIAPMRHDEVNAAVTEALPQGTAIVAAVGDQARGLLLRVARALARDRHLGERGLGEVDLRPVGSRKVHSERNTRAVDQYHELGALTLACEADAGAPFFAGAKVASRNASLQSSWPRPSSSLRNARHSVSHTSWRCHSASRRQHVAGLGYRAGRSPHRTPVRNTQRMPSRQPRSSARGRPPFGYRLGFGNSGAMRAHCASVSNGAIRPSLGGFVQPITQTRVLK